MLRQTEVEELPGGLIVVETLQRIRLQEKDGIVMLVENGGQQGIVGQNPGDLTQVSPLLGS